MNRESYKAVYEEVMKELDKLENEFLPQVKLSTLEVSAGNLRSLSSLTKDMSSCGVYLFIGAINTPLGVYSMGPL